MKKLCMALMLVLPALLNLNAQNITVKGQVIEADDKSPVEQATVQLFSLPDTTYTTGAATLQQGRFTLNNVKPGDYLLRISFIGYNNADKVLKVARSPQTVDVGTVALYSDAILLESAVIVAEAPPVTIKEDTTVYNASAYRVAEGAMLEELVKRLPGAEIDEDGNITINGKEVKKIMVDGKEFFSDDPKVSLKNLPAEMVENVKSYDRKSDMARITGIEDGEEEAVLDLTVKKDMKQGCVGNIFAGYGSEDRYEIGGNMNRFKDDASFSVIGSLNNTNNKGFSEFGDSGGGQGMGGGTAEHGITKSKSIGLNFAKDTEKLQYGGNVQYGHSDNDARRKSSTETFLQDQSSFENSMNTSRRRRDDLRADLRFEWRPDSMTTIIFRPSANYGHTKSDSYSESETLNDSKQPVNSAVNDRYGTSDNYSVNGRLQIFRRFNKPGRNVSLGVNFGISESESETHSWSETMFFNYDDLGVLEEEKDSLSTIERRTDQNRNSRNYRLSGSYTEPVFAKHYLQLRYEFSHQYSLSKSLVYDQDTLLAGITPDGFAENLSNKVENYYNTHTVNLSLRGVYPKMMYNAGVGMTPQSSRSETTIGPNSGKPSLTQNVINVAPSAMFRYSFTKQHVLMFRYNGRSNAPSVENLQEIIDNTDPLNLQYGNPDLKPSFDHQFSLNYRKFVPESMRSYNLNLFYNNTLNSIANKLVYNNETGGRESYKVNINGNWSTKGFFSFNTPFKNKKFTFSSNTNVAFSDAVSYTSVTNDRNQDESGEQDRNAESILSTTHNFRAGEKVTGSYRSDLFDLSLNASVNYNLARNSKQKNSNRETFDYVLGGSTNINLPWRLYFSSDVDYRIKSGYSGDFVNNEVIWNTQLSKNLLKNNRAMIRIKYYDILKQRSNLTRSISETRISDTEYDTLGSYFMVHFVYRINMLGSNAPRRGGPGGFDDGRRGSGGGGFRPPRI
ncbi:MAG: outer membrane beta-barrel protein [Bacteroides sp.]|nr:outer membrane beta-barrel protein [Bacteroides sp.]